MPTVVLKAVIFVVLEDPQGFDAGKKITGRKRHILVDEIAPELTGHGLPLGKCEAYNGVYF